MQAHNYACIYKSIISIGQTYAWHLYKTYCIFIPMHTHKKTYTHVQTHSYVSKYGLRAHIHSKCDIIGAYLNSIDS